MAEPEELALLQVEGRPRALSPLAAHFWAGSRGSGARSYRPTGPLTQRVPADPALPLCHTRSPAQNSILQSREALPISRNLQRTLPPALAHSAAEPAGISAGRAGEREPRREKGDGVARRGQLQRVPAVGCMRQEGPRGAGAQWPVTTPPITPGESSQGLYQNGV